MRQLLHLLLLCVRMVTLLVSIILNPAAAAQLPDWVDAYQKGSLVNEDNYLGVGSADCKSERPENECLRLSKDRALEDLSYQLSVSITSQLEENLSQRGDYSQEQITSSLLVSTRKVLNGVTEKEKWTDLSESRHWVLLTIDKDSAQLQVQKQDFIKEIADRLENNQSEIKQGLEVLHRKIDENNKRTSKGMQNIEELLIKMNAKLDLKNTGTQTEYNPLVEKIQLIEQHWQSQEKTAKNQSARMDYLINQNQLLTQKLAQMFEMIKKDRYLPYLEDDVRTQLSSQDFKITITPEKGESAQYLEGETIRFFVKSNRDCYIKVIYSNSINPDNHDETRMNTLLFPNFYDRDNQIEANKSILIGRRDELTVEPPFGKDIITVVASTTQFEDMEKLLKEAAEQYHSYETRSIQGAVEARGIGVRRRSATVTDTSFIISRPK
ncbi:MAG: DUF4384 domain-containing protein [Desulfobacteraceae bacterium]